MARRSEFEKRHLVTEIVEAVMRGIPVYKPRTIEEQLRTLKMAKASLEERQKLTGDAVIALGRMIEALEPSESENG